MLVGLLMVAGGAVAGVFGSLLGLGGGVLIVPLLTLGFGLPLREAVGVSLVCVIMTSSAAAGVYLERHVANLRLGMSLELFTAIGALVGGSIAFLLDERLLAVLFAGLLLYVAVTMFRAGRRDTAGRRRTPTRPRGPLPSIDVDDDLPSHGMAIGVAGSFGAGIVSALLGVGGGHHQGPADEPRDGRARCASRRPRATS